VTKEITLGTCDVDSPDCPIGFCGFTDITGQFWQNSSDSKGYLRPDFHGSYATIRVVNHHYTISHGIQADYANES
jgi:hypothetical protein